MKRKILLLTLALPAFLVQDVQAQLSSRLLASSHSSYTDSLFTPVDSSTYAYSFGRGGSMDLNPTAFDAVSMNMNMMLFSNSTGYTFIGDSAVNNTYTVQAFDGNNNDTSSITSVWDFASSTWKPSTKQTTTYNSGNMPTSATSYTWNTVDSSWHPVSQDVALYNSAGNLYVVASNTWNSLTSLWDPASQKTYYYDAMQNRTNETDQVWSFGSPVYTNQVMRTWSGSNQLLTTTYNTWSGTAWVNNNRNTHAYDSLGNPLSILNQKYNTGTHAWDNNTLDQYSNYTGAHLPQSVSHKVWDTTSPGTWANNMQATYLYNSFNQVTNMLSESWDTSHTYKFLNGDQNNKYYYQGYSVTKVQSVTKNETVNIYPVPAQNMLHIDLNWTVAQSATISLLDVTGNVVRQWNVPAATQYNSAVSVNGLASGIYIVKILGEKDQVVKQIVVAH